MAEKVIDYKDIKSLLGQELGASDWHLVTQEEINTFAHATHDHQWIHVDVERAKKESPFGGPVAHGYYTLSLAPYLIQQIWSVEGVRMGLNYGLNRLRFPAPLPVGKRVRLRGTLNSVEDVPGGQQVTVGVSFEVEGGEKPVCVAEAIYRYYAS
ncbi:MAG: MaoC family dehydratase [Candidatus Methylomirabilia bacterium]